MIMCIVPTMVFAQREIATNHLSFSGIDGINSIGEARQRYIQNFKLDNRHSISFDFGIEPLLNNKLTSWEMDMYDSYHSGDECSDLPYCGISDIDIREVVITYPSLNLTYGYRLSRTFAVELTTGYAGEKSNIHDLYSDKYRYSNSKHTFYLMAALRLNWYNTKYFSLYASFGLGGAFTTSHNNESDISYSESDTRFLVHFVPLGVKVGGRLFGFLEVSPSPLGVLRVGLGYSF